MSAWVVVDLCAFSVLVGVILGQVSVFRKAERIIWKKGKR